MLLFGLQVWQFTLSKCHPKEEPSTLFNFPKAALILGGSFSFAKAALKGINLAWIVNFYSKHSIFSSNFLLEQCPSRSFFLFRERKNYCTRLEIIILKGTWNKSISKLKWEWEREHICWIYLSNSSIAFDFPTVVCGYFLSDGIHVFSESWVE